MKAEWTVFAIAVECGCAQGAHSIAPGEPVHVIGAAVYRCQLHASVSVDMYAITAAEQEFVRARARRKVIAVPPADRRAGVDIRALERDVNRRLARPPVDSPRRPLRLPPIRKIKPASAPGVLTAFDPKAAAAGD